MAGGTFTITNVGVFGVDAGTPIINPGESAILCFGAINKRPWVDEDGEIVVRDVTTLALSFDHRHIDGEKGSRFLADVGRDPRGPGDRAALLTPARAVSQPIFTSANVAGPPPRASRGAVSGRARRRAPRPRAPR